MVYWSHWRHNNHHVDYFDPCVWLYNVSSLIKCYCLWSERDQAGQHSHDSVKSCRLEIKAANADCFKQTAAWIRRHVDRHMMWRGFCYEVHRNNLPQEVRSHLWVCFLCPKPYGERFTLMHFWIWSVGVYSELISNSDMNPLFGLFIRLRSGGLVHVKTHKNTPLILSVNPDCDLHLLCNRLNEQDQQMAITRAHPSH